ncbi:MAG: hypothetical protein JNL58_19915 [Planctomyces sp.]|nr:hypothetical protein [Planctomyces sp.]
MHGQSVFAQSVFAQSVFARALSVGGLSDHVKTLLRLGNPSRRTRNRRSKATTNAAVQFDLLEDRALLAAVTMTDNEQLLLELINRARANPTAEAALHGVGLNDGLAAGTITTTPKQPLAPHQSLTDAAQKHSQDMIDRDFFAHNNPSGLTPQQRTTAEGYPSTLVGENIAMGRTTGTIDQIQQVYDRHSSLFKSPGHRQNMLHVPYEEVGTGIRYGVYTESGTNWNAALVTENFGIRTINPYITGVVYTDSNSNNFYNVGEAIRTGTITAYNTATQAVFTETIGNSGGYGISVPAGTYSVSARYNVGQTPVVAITTVTVGTDNLKVDFVTGSATSVGLTLTSPTTTLSEIGGTTSSVFTVTRTGDLGTAVVFAVSTSDSTETSVPATVTIPVGQTSATFTVNSVNDLIVDGNQTSTITVSATGYPTRNLTVTTTDKTAPILPSTPQNSTSYRPTFTWQGVNNAATYELWLSRAAGTQERILLQSGIVGTSFTPAFDLGIGVYRVWVRGVTSGGTNGAWSTPQDWRVITAPVVTNHGSTVASSAFTISWNAIQGATAYDVWVDNLTTSTSQFYRNTNVSGTSVNVTGFPIGTYGIWVRGRNAGGEWGNYSARAVVRVSITPTGLDVSGANFSDTPVMTWLSVPGASGYEIWVDAHGSSPYFQDRNVAGLVRAIPGATAGDFKVWVRAKDSVGNYYNWSPAFAFQYQQTSRILTPSGGGQSSTPVFTWTPVAGVQRYELWVSSLSGAGKVIHQTDIETESFVPTTPLAAGIYRSWIRAFDSTGANLGWSSSLDFTVAVIDGTSGSPADDFLNSNLTSVTLPLRSNSSEQEDQHSKDEHHHNHGIAFPDSADTQSEMNAGDSAMTERNHVQMKLLSSRKTEVLHKLIDDAVLEFMKLHS